MGGCRRRLAIALASVAALAAFPAAVHADVRIGPSTIVVRGASGRATITRSPFRVSFADAAGRRVLRESPSTARTLTLTPPPPPLLAGYDPPLQDTLYAPLAFTVGTERTTARDSGQWSGNLESSVRTGTVYGARVVRSARRAGRGVRLVVATSDPSGRVLVVTIAPDRGGSLHVAVRPSPSQGVVGMADSFTTGRDEAFRGFGGRHLRLDQRGRAFFNWTNEENLDAQPFRVPGSGAGTLLYPNGPEAAYYPQASFISSRPYGFLLDRPELARFRMASDRPDAWQADVSARSLDYVVAPGPATRALATLTSITGRQRVPPPWAVRPMLDRATALGQDPAAYLRQVRRDLRDIDRYRLPLGGYRIEGWQILPAAKVRGIIRALQRRGIKALLYFRCFVSDDVAGTESKGAFAEAIAKGLVARTKSGEPFLFGNSFGGRSGLLDFTNPATRRWWRGRVRAALDLGADGFMQDFGEETLPGMRFFDGETGATMHNRYPAVYHRATRRVVDGYERQNPGRRIFFFTRAGYSGRPGGAAYENANFPGDETTDWTRSSGIASQVPDMLNRAVGGAYGFTTDIGGYFDVYNGTPTTKELFLRWAQLAALTPFFRLHGSLIAGVHTPWSFDAQTVRLYNALSRLHDRARPLILRLWREAVRTGMPPTRPLWLAYPGDGRAARQDQEWLLGRDVLVAPVVAEGARRRTVYFPRGCWRQPVTRLLVRGPRTRTIPAPLSRLPYFVRCGTRPFATGR